GESPGPGGAVVIGGFAPRVLVALVAALVRFGRIVQQMAVSSVNRQGGRDRHWRERTERAGNNEVTQRCVTTALRPLAGNEAATDREETIASQRRIHDGRRPRFAASCNQQVGKVTEVL